MLKHVLCLFVYFILFQVSDSSSLSIYGTKVACKTKPSINETLFANNTVKSDGGKLLACKGKKLARLDFSCEVGDENCEKKNTDVKFL